MAGEHTIRLVPLRVGTKPIGLLAATGRVVEPGTLDALAAVVAIAIERASLLDERKAAEIARRGEDLKTALLASLAHDLRTPLTAIRVAASNLQSPQLGADQLREQSALILGEAERLSRAVREHPRDGAHRCRRGRRPICAGRIRARSSPRRARRSNAPLRDHVAATSTSIPTRRCVSIRA